MYRPGLPLPAIVSGTGTGTGTGTARFASWEEPVGNARSAGYFPQAPRPRYVAPMPFRPALVPTLFVALGLSILLALGTWQLSRNGEALTRLAEIESRQSASALTNADISGGRDLFWHTADLEGEWTGQPML